MSKARRKVQLQICKRLLLQFQSLSTFGSQIFNGRLLWGVWKTTVNKTQSAALSVQFLFCLSTRQPGSGLNLKGHSWLVAPYLQLAITWILHPFLAAQFLWIQLMCAVSGFEGKRGSICICGWKTHGWGKSSYTHTGLYQLAENKENSWPRLFLSSMVLAARRLHSKDSQPVKPTKNKQDPLPCGKLSAEGTKNFSCKWI